MLDAQRLREAVDLGADEPDAGTLRARRASTRRPRAAAAAITWSACALSAAITAAPSGATMRSNRISFAAR